MFETARISSVEKTEYFLLKGLEKNINTCNLIQNVVMAQVKKIETDH